MYKHICIGKGRVIQQCKDRDRVERPSTPGLYETIGAEASKRIRSNDSRERLNIQVFLYKLLYLYLLFFFIFFDTYTTLAGCVENGFYTSFVVILQVNIIISYSGPRGRDGDGS
jgi:hypothetical protein